MKKGNQQKSPKVRAAEKIRGVRRPPTAKAAWADLETRFSGPPNVNLDMASLISADRGG
jgi:hypothetical protein